MRGSRRELRGECTKRAGVNEQRLHLRLAGGRRGLVEEPAVDVALALHALGEVPAGGTRAHAPLLLALHPPDSPRRESAEPCGLHLYPKSDPSSGGSAS